MSNPIKNRYEFVLYFDVEDGNPNGDPDAGNMPRTYSDSSFGYVTDVCLKRKIRNYVQTVKEGEPGFEIYIQDGATLNSCDERAFEQLGIAATKAEVQKAKKNDPALYMKLRDIMCGLYYDVRTFGAVMTTFTKKDFNLNCGQVRGPVQLSFSRSLDVVIPQEVAITRKAIATEEDAKKKSNEMGRKYIIPYALYRCEGFISANLARKVTGFSEEDLVLLWEAIINMFENDRSASRGKMAVRALIVFKHDSELGNAPAHKLFEAVDVASRPDPDSSPRSFKDYGDIVVDEAAIPDGVTVIRMV